MLVALKAKGLDVGRYQARRFTQEAGVMATYPKKKRHRYPVGEVSCAVNNPLNREFEANAPNQKWMGGGWQLMCLMWSSVMGSTSLKCSLIVGLLNILSLG